MNEEDPKNILKESVIKRKLNVMCQKPQKLLVHFYNDKEDISLGLKLIELAVNSIKKCTFCQ